MVQHIPVLKNEVIHYWDTNSKGIFLDMTFGAGGHSKLLLDRLEPEGRLFVIDADNEAYIRAKKLAETDKRVTPLKGNFEDFDKLLKMLPNKVLFDGVLADLGLSMLLIKNSGRGFSFQGEEELDMRFDLNLDLTAKEIVNSWSKKELENIFSEYGEEKYSKEIAEEIVSVRKKNKIITAAQLVDVIKSVKKGGKINGATKVFQALRIAVNDELGVLQRMLDKIPGYMNHGGRLLIISFHSLEDRIVKNSFKRFEKSGFGVRVEKKVVTASKEEYLKNRPSRSAKLRIFEFRREL